MSSLLTSARCSYMTTRLSSTEIQLLLSWQNLNIHYVWAGISRRGTTRILIFEDIMDANFYIHAILTTGLIPFINRVYHDSHRLQQDNDPKHTANATKEFFMLQNINWWNVWPSESPDFNPIEMVWAMMTSSISKKRTKDKTRPHIQH